jgi:peroxiredoxin/outer membrane lipoprotein-sorting protein
MSGKGVDRRTIFAAIAIMFGGSLGFMPGARAQDNEATADNDAANMLRRQVMQVYAKADTYQAEITFQVSMKEGRWRLIQEIEVAVDRKTGQFRIIRPDLELVSDGRRMYFRTDMVPPGRYQDREAPATPLTYMGVLDAAPYLGSLAMPGFMLTLGDDPLLVNEQLRLGDPAPDGRHVVTCPMGAGGDVTYLIDPKRHVVTGVRWIQSKVTKSGMRGATEMSMEIKVVKHGEALDASLFTFDPGGDQAVATLQELVAGPGRAGMSAAPAGPSAEDLIGQAPPPIKLLYLDGKAFQLADIKADVIVLDFWATWCAPCTIWLPRLNEIDQWAKKENKSVAVIGVNVRESTAQVKKFWLKNKATFPTILDRQGRANEAYRVTGIPQTVVISKGKVRYVHSGVLGVEGEASARLLKSQIESLLAGDE